MSGQSPYRVQEPVIQRLWVPGAVPSLNDLIAARGVSQRVAGTHKRVDRYTKLKAMWEQRVALCARTQRLPQIEPSYFTYLFREEHRRRDPSNFIAAGMKLIEDGLQKAGLLSNDGWAHVLGVAAYWMTDIYAPGTTVFFSNRMPLDRLDAIWRDNNEREKHGQVRRKTEQDAR